MGPSPQATTHSTSGKRKCTSCRSSQTGRAVVRSAWNSSPSVTAKRAARAVRQRRLNSGIAPRSARCRRARRGGGRGGGGGGGGRGGWGGGGGGGRGGGGRGGGGGGGGGGEGGGVKRGSWVVVFFFYFLFL